MSHINVQIVPDIAEDIKASGEPIQIRDIVIDIHQEQSSNCSVDINNEETKQLDISVLNYIFIYT